MKTRLGVLIFVFLMGVILGATQPGFLYAGAETTGGTLWDPFLNVSFFTLRPVSYAKVNTQAAHLKLNFTSTGYETCSLTNLYWGTLYYTVSGAYPLNIPWQFTSFTSNICAGNIGTPGSGGEGDVIMGFLKTVVLQIFPFAKDAYLESVNNAMVYDDGFAFEADIIIAVKLF
jgi:hypothetical protein